MGAALALGCGQPRVDDETGTSTTSEAAASDGVSETGVQQPTGDAGATSTTGEPATATSSTSTSSATAGDPSGATSGFVVTPDADRGPVECDLWEQDCQDDEKCAPWAEGGGSSWNATKCVPVTGDRMPGEPCTGEGGGVTGLDDCIKGALCWVDAKNHGVCTELCHGSLSPLCSDPGNFGCSEFANACDPGLGCFGPAAASECDQMGVGCCLPMCSIAAGGEACPGAGQDCLPVYEPPPPGFEDIGFCSRPP